MQAVSGFHFAVLLFNPMEDIEFRLKHLAAFKFKPGFVLCVCLFDVAGTSEQARGYNLLHGRSFNGFELSKVFGTREKTFDFHISNFAERGLLTVLRTPGCPNTYTFNVNPQSHPQCFQNEKSTGHNRTSEGGMMPTFPLSAAGL